MADSNFRGPVNSMGALEVDAATTAVQPLDGPSILYQGMAIPDLRSAPFAKDSSRPGDQPSFYSGNQIIVIDTIPQARSSTVIAAAQGMTSGSTVTLVTAQIGGVASAANIAIGVPIVPVGTSVATFAAMALDFGFTTGTTVANSSTVTVVDSALFGVGQWIVIAGAANTGGSRSLVTQVTAVPGSTTINISPVAATGISNVPIGQGNLHAGALLPIGTPFGPATVSASGHAFGGGMAGGLARIYNPREMLSRNLAFQSANTASGAAWSAVISGWDVYGNAMTEIVTGTTSVTTYMSKKAFKYISSITCGTTGTSMSVGLGDVVGLPIRADYAEQLSVWWNGNYMTNTVPFVGPTTVTTVANGTTDVRGTLQLSTAILTGGLATSIGTTTNGTGRLFVSINNEPMIMGRLANPVNPTLLFGVAQYTATT